MTAPNGIEMLSSGTYDHNPSSYIVGGGQIAGDAQPSGFNVNASNYSSI